MQLDHTNNEARESPAFSYASFDNVDDFVDFERERGWSVDSTQISPGAYQLDIGVFFSPNISVSRMTTRQALSDRFVVPDDAVMFSLGRKSGTEIWNGKRVPPGMMNLCFPGIEHRATLPAGWGDYEITVSRRYARQIDLFPDSFYDRTPLLEHACLPLANAPARRLVARLDTHFEHARHGHVNQPDPASTTDISETIALDLMEVVDAGTGAGIRHRLTSARRSDLVDKATDCIDAKLASRLSIQSLCRELGVSARVLNYAFKDNLGVSPYRYILSRKLHAVRQQLRDSDEPIVEIIARFGFETPSRFARQYARLFGERPSTTRYGI